MINCPKCKQECDGEAPNDKRPYYLHCECECGLEFAYDTYRDEAYDLNGDVIKEVVK